LALLALARGHAGKGVGARGAADGDLLSRVATAPVPMAVALRPEACECAPIEVDWKPVASAW
jgi:hypothetical protein